MAEYVIPNEDLAPRKDRLLAILSESVGRKFENYLLRFRKAL